MRIRIIKSSTAPKPIHRAAHAGRAAVENMGVDHRRPDVAASKEFLDSPDIVAFLQPVGREGVLEGGACHVACLVQTRLHHSLSNRFLHQ